jgi:hypothetical protein
MAHYKIGQQVVSSEQVGFDRLLESFYPIQETERPVCICKEPGNPMYIARVGGKYIIKRMPNTGSSHALDCESYEPPEDMSGLGEVLGSAIEHLPDGYLNLKFDFALTKTSGKAPAGAPAEAMSVVRDPKRLTLAGYLDCLWAEAQLTKWRPGMAGKRTWPVVYRLLMEALEKQVTKNTPLSDITYIPEPWTVERKEEIDARRMARIRPFSAGTKSARKLMIVIGEFKEARETGHGQMLIIKHVPTYPFLMDQKLYEKLLKQFDWAFQLQRAHENGHLMVACTVTISEVQIATVEEIALKFMDENWLPVDDNYDKMMIDKLLAEKRSFIRQLRYNMPRSRPIAPFHLQDAAFPFNLYIDTRDNEEYQHELQKLLASEQSPDHYTVWRTGEGKIPALPPKREVGPFSKSAAPPFGKRASVVNPRSGAREEVEIEGRSPKPAIVQ